MKREILIAMSDDKLVPIVAHIIRPGIGVHRLVANGEVFDIWSVTHVATGRLVGNFSFWRFADACNFAQWLPDIDWQAASIEEDVSPAVRRQIKLNGNAFRECGRAVANEFLDSLIHDGLVKHYRKGEKHSE